MRAIFVAEIMSLPSSYRKNQLSSLLLELQRDRVSSIVRVEAEGPNLQERVLVFHEGLLTYAGKAIPSPWRLVNELSQYIQISLLDTILGFAAKRASVQDLLVAMVKIGVLTWSDIKTAIRKQAIDILIDLGKTSGKIVFEPVNCYPFDLTYDRQDSGFDISSLLLEIDACQQGCRTLTRTDGARKATEGGSNNPTILSVDDSPISQALIKRILGRDYHTITCNSPLEVLRNISQYNDIMLMILDITMPEMDGLELCRMVRKVDRFKHLPVIMLTARDSIIDRCRGRLAGANHYLSKPVIPAELRKLVAHYALASQG